MSQIEAVTPFDVNRMIKAYYTRDNATTGWYLATPDGPVPPAPANLGGGKAVGHAAKVLPAPLQAFERHPAPPRHPAAPTRLELPNGLALWLVPHPESRTIALAGFVRAGSADDPPGKADTAQAVASLLDAGSRRRDKASQALELEEVGATLEFDGRPVATAFSGRCLPPDLDRLVDALAERLREPAFPALELGRLVGTWHATVAQADDEPEQRARRELARALFPPGHPLYQLAPAEELKQLAGLTREDLLAFHQRHYGANATTIVLAGNFKPALAEAAVRRAFGDWGRVALPALAPPPALPDAPARVAIAMPDKTNVFILVGNAAPVRRDDPAYYAYALANEILGGDTWTSRLGAKLRDELGLTYGTYAELDAGLVAGSWDATVTVNPANAEAALAALRQELVRFASRGVGPQELAFAKRALVGGQAAALATNEGQAQAVARMAMFGLGPDHWARFPAAIERVRLDEVNAAARRLVRPGALRVVIAGPAPPTKGTP
jgi:zinc protease